MMQINSAYRAVLTAHCATNDQRKKLNQSDRKVLLLCCKALGDPRLYASLEKKEKQVKSVIKKLSDAKNPIIKPCCCQFLVSFFKTIANIFHWRIGIKRFERELNLGVNASIKKNGRYLDIHQEILSTLMSPRSFHVKNRAYIIKTIEKFCLLNIHASKIKNLPIHNPTKEDYLLVKKLTGLKIDDLNAKTHNLLVKASDVLVDKYIEAKEKGKTAEFFKEAFSPQDKHFEKQIQRIQNFKIPENHDFRNPPVVMPNQAPLVNPVYAPKKVESTALEKDDFFFKHHENFIEFQLQEYARKEQVRNYIGEPWQAIKDRIFPSRQFKNNYQTEEMFEKYLKDQKVIGKNCKDGAINEQDIKDIIKRYVDFEMLFKKVVEIKPQIIPVQPNYYRDKKADADDKIKQLVAENRVHEQSPLFDEILVEAMKFNCNKTVTNLIEGIHKLALYQKELLEYTSIAENRNYEGWYFPQKLLGVIIHMENPEKETKYFLENAPGILLEGYKGAKKSGKLKHFFGDAFISACLEYCMVHMQEYIKNNMLEDVDVKILLAPPMTPLVNKTETKQKNIGRIFEVFTDLEARKYAKIHNIQINTEWLIAGEKGTKGKIFLDDAFLENYANNVNFILYLRDKVKCIGQETSEGAITEKDIYDYAQIYVDAYSLGEVAISKKKSKEQNLSAMKDLFIERQALLFAEDTEQELDSNWDKPEGTKAKILKQTDFTQNYLTQEKLLKFFEEDLKLIGKKTSEGEITKEDFSNFSLK